MSKPNVIVVDDDVTNVGLIKMLLEMDGFQATTCDSIASAKDATRPDTDALIIDCYLSRGTNGLDLLTAVRGGHTAAPTDTIIIMTSGDHRLEDEAIEKGATLFMQKPYSPSKLSAALDTLLHEGDSNG